MYSNVEIDLKKTFFAPVLKRVPDMIRGTIIQAKLDASEEQQLTIAGKVIRPVMSETLRGVIPTKELLVEYLNYLESSFDKKLLLVTLGLSKDDVLSELLWRSEFLTVDTFEYILDSIHQDSDKKLFIDCCMPEYTLAAFCDTNPQLQRKVASFVDIEAQSFQNQIALAKESKANVAYLGSIFDRTHNHTVSGTRGWDGLVVYSYEQSSLETLEPFLIAAKNKDIDSMREILVADRQTGKNKSLLDISGGYSNLLILCTESNLVEGVAAIIEELTYRKRTSSNQQSISSIARMISHALRYAKSTEAASILLSGGAELGCSGELGWTALRYACGESTSLVEFYLNQGANIETRARDGETPLMAAASNNKSDIVSLLLRRGAEIEAQDNNGDTALQYAAEKPEVMRILLEHNANIHHKNKFGRTVLHETVRLGAFLSTQLLLESGADIFVGKPTAYEFAKENCLKGSSMKREFSKTAELVIRHAKKLKSAELDQTTAEVISPEVTTMSATERRVPVAVSSNRSSVFSRVDVAARDNQSQESFDANKETIPSKSECTIM